jgi:peptidoglycan/LPS O-acetylase OafA/YrhL
VTVQVRDALPARHERAVTGRRPDIQGLRAVAVVLVVLFHAGLPIPGGFAGVDIFFVISGFVITEQLQRLHRSGQFTFVRFYARRMRRLLPAMLVMVAATVVVSVLLQSPLGAQQVTVKTAIGGLLMLGNGVILMTTGNYFDASAESNPLLHVWSLSVEEQFYLIFPAAIILGWQLGKRRAFTIIAVLTGASFLGGVVLTYSSLQFLGVDSGEFAFYSSPTRAWEFGIGALLAMRLTMMPEQSTRNWKTLGSLGALVLAATAFMLAESTRWPGVWAVVPVAGTALLLVAGAGANGWATRVLSTRYMVLAGDLSYSIYLWHWPAIVFARLLYPDTAWAPAVAALISLGPAYLCFVLVESRFRQPTGVRSRRVLWAGLGIMLAVSVLLYAVQTTGTALIQNFSTYQTQRQELTYGRSTDCMLNHRVYQTGDIERCTITVSDSRGWILLVGDSHADAISTGTIDAATKLGYDTVAITGAGCTFSRTAPPSKLMPNCAALASDLLDKATGSEKPALVVMSHAVAPRIEVEPNWIDRLADPLNELDRANVPVLFVLDVPNFGTEATGEISACHGGIANFSCESTEANILKHQGRSRAAELALISGRRGVTKFDTWTTFCERGKCNAIVNGQLGYWDYDHLNGIGSLALSKPLERAIRASVD